MLYSQGPSPDSSGEARSVNNPIPAESIAPNSWLGCRGVAVLGLALDCSEKSSRCP